VTVAPLFSCGEIVADWIGIVRASGATAALVVNVCELTVIVVFAGMPYTTLPAVTWRSS